MGNTVTRSKGTHPAIALFVFAVACAMTFGEVSAQVATHSIACFTATLQVFVTSSGQLIGTLSNDGGGRFRGEFSWPVNPQSITVRSSFGGQATRAVTLR